MAKLKIKAPDGKNLNIDVPEGTDPSEYDSIVDKVISDYSGEQEAPSQMGSLARGAMSGIPGATALVSGIEALSPDKTYEEAHKELEDATDKDWQENPIAYGVGKTAGIVGTGLVAPVSIPAAVTMGALSGADAATSKDALLESGLKGAGTGAVLGTVGEKVVSPALNAIGKASGSLLKRALATLGKNATVEDIERYLSNSAAVNAAGTAEDVGNTIGNLTEDVTKASRHLSEGARSALNPDNVPLSVPAPKLPSQPTGLVNSAGQEISKDLTKGAVSLEDTLKPIFDEAKDAYYRNGVVVSGAEPAVNALNTEYTRIAEMAKLNGGQINETLLRGLVDDLQDAIKDKVFGNPDVSVKQEALRNLSGKLNGILQKANPEYAAKMAPSAEAAGLSADLQKGFKLDQFDPTDATGTKVNNLVKPAKPEEAALSGRLKDLTGVDVQEQLKNALTKEHLTSGGAGEAMKALFATLGFGAGKMTSAPYGGIAGAAGGRFSANAVNGGSIAKQIMDTYLQGAEAFNNSAMKPLMAKFGPILIKAAKQGGNNLAATHFVLATSDPEYQKLTEHMQKNQPSEDKENTGIRNEE